MSISSATFAGHMNMTQMPIVESSSITKSPRLYGVSLYWYNKFLKLDHKLDELETQESSAVNEKFESLNDRITELNSQNQDQKETISRLTKLLGTKESSLEEKERKLLITTSVLEKVVKEMSKIKIQAESRSSEWLQD